MSYQESTSPHILIEMENLGVWKSMHIFQPSGTSLGNVVISSMKSGSSYVGKCITLFGKSKNAKQFNISFLPFDIKMIIIKNDKRKTVLYKSTIIKSKRVGYTNGTCLSRS